MGLGHPAASRLTSTIVEEFSNQDFVIEKMTLELTVENFMID